MADEYSKQRRLFEEDRGGFAFRELFTPDREGPLPPQPRPHRSGKGGPSLGADGKPIIPGGGTTSVWSASDAAANGMTLSNGGLTVTPSGAALWDTIRTSPTGKTSGKLYIEFMAAITGASDNIFFGLASSSFDPTHLFGTSNYSAGIGLQSTGVLASSGFTGNYGLAAQLDPVVGEVWALAVDFTAGSVWLARNNAWINSSNPATASLPVISFAQATVGALFAAAAFSGGSIPPWTLQATAASLKYLPPPGFQAWDGGPVTPSTSVWSASDAAANGFTLSNGGLTYSDNTFAFETIRGTVGKSSGKLYVEFLAVTSSGNYHMGFADAGFNSGGLLGSSNYSAGVYYGSNTISAGFTSNYATNDIVGTGGVINLAIDFSTGNIWYGINGVWSNGSNPTTGTLPIISFVPSTVGVLFPAISERNPGTSWTLQATAASQKYAPPAGFSAWDGGAALTPAQAYLARTVGGNEGGNAANITTLIDGLVADGVWAKLDALYVFAQQNETDAKLNLISASYPLTGTATFAAYQGFAGSLLETSFDPSTAISPRYIRNSASLGIWSYAVIAEAATQFKQNAASNFSLIYDEFTNANFIGGANSDTGSFPQTPTTITKGLFAVDRLDAANVYFYQNGASPVQIASPSLAVSVGSFQVTGNASAQTLSAAFIGASLGAAGQLALYNRLRTYMTAVGVP